MGKTFFISVLFLLFVSSAQTQEKFTISGHITDAETGEALLGAAFQVVELKTGSSGGNDIDITSGIENVNLKEDFQYFINTRHALRFGVNTIRHRFIPGVITASDSSTVNSYKIRDKYVFESAAYIAHEYTPTEKLKFDYGLRFSLFNIRDAAGYMASEHEHRRPGNIGSGLGGLFPQFPQ